MLKTFLSTLLVFLCYIYVKGWYNTEGWGLGIGAVGAGEQSYVITPSTQIDTVVLYSYK